jgi:hypothetical protein
MSRFEWGALAVVVAAWAAFAAYVLLAQPWWLVVIFAPQVFAD